MQKLRSFFDSSGSRSRSTLTQRRIVASERQLIAEDTLARASDIVSQHTSEGATDSSTFIAEQLEPLDASNCPNCPASAVEVVNSDAFTAARQIITTDQEAKGKTTVLNLASDAAPAGGWLYSLSKTQEEALCYSSTLYPTLKESYYPWPNVGPGSDALVFSPGVVIFKHDLDNDCRDLELEERQVVSVITVAAPRHRPLSKDRLAFKNSSDLEDLKGKIRLVYRTSAHYGQRYLVLGAMGCGAYACPPRLVAEQMKAILLEPEFKGWFQKVIFAVYSKGEGGFGPSNFDIFSEVFQNTTIGSDPS